MNALQRAVLRAVVRLTDGLALVGAIAVVGLTALVTKEVLWRYLFNSPSTWSDEIASFALLTITFLGLAHTLRMGGHIRIDLATRLLPRAGRYAMEILAHLVGLAFAVFMLLASYDRVANFWHRNTRSYSTLETPLYLPASILVVGSAVFALVMAAGLWAYLAGRPEEVEPPESGTLS